jgi:hypothetical protein
MNDIMFGDWGRLSPLGKVMYGPVSYVYDQNFSSWKKSDMCQNDTTWINHNMYTSYNDLNVND